MQKQGVNLKPVVFVSSAIEEFREERRIAKVVIDSYPFLESWVFEQEGASAAPLEERYLQEVRNCSIFLVLLGQVVTKPVRKEFLEAKANGKRILVLLKQSDSMSDNVSQLICQADAKYGFFQDSSDFEGTLRQALNNEISRAVAEPIEKRAAKRKETRLCELSSTAVRITPVFPQGHNQDLYNIKEVSPEEVILLKRSSQHRIDLPLEKIAIVPGPNGEPATLQLDGRLQWLSAKREWKFFPEHPLGGHGISKPGSPGGPDVTILRDRLQRIGIPSQWNQEHEATFGQYSIAYDDDGRYFKCENRMHRGSVEVLVAMGC
ncbi:MAG: DUF4062 domain-containing protein [Candidatus Acidiferrales bacterium]